MTTNHVTESYVARCLDGDQELRHAMRDASRRFPPAFLASCGRRLLSRPMFKPEAEIRAFADDLVRLVDLLTAMPGRLFDGDLERYCEALGIDTRRAALLTRLGGRPLLYGRADLYHDGAGFKLLELNLGSELGGTDRAEISRALLEVDAFRAFAERYRLGYVHTGERVAAALRTAAEPLTGGAAPVVAFVESDGGLPEYLHLVLSFQEMMAGLGIEVVLGEVSQVRSEGGRLWLHGRPVDVVLRYFTATRVAGDQGAEHAVETMVRAHEEGRVVLWTTMQSALYANKGCLAMLSDARASGCLTTEEAALVDRVLPWTRQLTTALVDRCRAEREHLILKPRADFGGAGIVVGWKLDDAAWAEALATCAGSGYVVQRRVVPEREPVVDPETGRVEEWCAAWDAFLTPRGYAGSHIRALPADGGAVIGMGASPDCRTTGIFTFPDGGAG